MAPQAERFLLEAEAAADSDVVTASRAVFRVVAIFESLRDLPACENLKVASPLLS